MPIIQGTLLTFLPIKVIFSSKCACISSTKMTFLPNNQCGFTTKIPKKANCSSNWAYVEKPNIRGSKININYEGTFMLKLLMKINVETANVNKKLFGSKNLI